MSDIGAMGGSPQSSQQQVQIQVLKQATEMQGQGALQLLQSVTDTAVPTVGANPSERVGSTVDVKA